MQNHSWQPFAENAPAVSVVAAVYKGEWLNRLCESVAAQTFTDWECILVDDESPDDSGKVCDAWAAKDPRFKAIHKKNGGASSARNVGLAAARGRWVVIPDCDDELSPHALEYALEMEKQHPGAFVIWEYTGDHAAFEAGFDRPLAAVCLPRKQIDRLMVRRNLYFTAWNKLFDRKLLAENDLWFDENIRPEKDQYRIDPDGQWYGEDRDYVDRYMRLALDPTPEQPIAYTGNDLYYYDCTNTDAITRHIEVRVAGENAAMADEKNEQLALPADPTAYCQMLLDDYEQDARLDWIYGGDEHKTSGLHLSLLRSLAYGIWACRKTGKPLPAGMWAHPGLAGALAWCKQRRRYSPYYLPLRWHNAALAAKLYYLDASHSRNFGRMDWGFYYLLGGKWNR